MRINNHKFSLRALVVLTTACAWIVALSVTVALSVSYGRNILWALTHFRSPSHLAFVETVLSPKMVDQDFVRCDFLGLSLDLPIAMVGTATIRTGGAVRFLEFSEGDRKVHVVLSSDSENRAIFGTLPERIKEETTAQLLRRICTSDFSLNMSAEQLLLHEWALKYREVFSYERDLNQMAFDERDDLHVVTLCSLSMLSLGSSKMKRLISWSAKDGTDGGLIYIYDAEGADGDWGDRVASSIRLRQDATPGKTDFRTATDSKIIALVKFATTPDEPSVERKSTSPSGLLDNQSRRLR